MASCGSSSSRGSTATDADTATGEAGGNALIAFLNPEGVLKTGLAQRLPLGLGDSNGALLEQVPDSLKISIKAPDGTIVAQAADVPAHSKGLPRAYFPLPILLEEPGNYVASTTLGGKELTAAFNVAADIPIPQAGEPLPDIETPTTANPQGVTPICTQQPACSLHDTSLRQARTSGRPTALLISTPAFCQVGICGPVLDVLLSQQATFGNKVQFLHAEVYKDGAAAAKDIQTAQLAPVVDSFRLPFEPCLVVADAAGNISTRLDAIFDETELAAALRTVTA